MASLKKILAGAVISLTLLGGAFYGGRVSADYSTRNLTAVELSKVNKWEAKRTTNKNQIEQWQKVNTAKALVEEASSLSQSGDLEKMGNALKKLNEAYKILGKVQGETAKVDAVKNQINAARVDLANKIQP